MSVDTPEVRDLRLRRAWPPVEVVERSETRRELLAIAALMAVATAVYVIEPGIPDALALIPAFIAGATGQAGFLAPHVNGGGGS